jgi:HD-like signal output (HDOD) protein
VSGQLSLADNVNQALQLLSAEIEANRLQLPSPPDNVITLRNLIQQDADISEIATLLSKEPHLSARLIKLANSVLFHSRFHVSNVKTAITRLGMQKVSNLVTGFAITQSFLNNKTRGIEHELKRSWQISNRVASITTSLAQHHGQIDPDQALLAGQIHNIGDTPLLLHLNRLPVLIESPEMKQKVIIMVLKRLSAKVGTAILKKWQFPPDMVQLPFAAEQAPETSEETVQLEHLVFVGAALRNIDFTATITNLPPSLLESPVFHLLWDSEEAALNQLNALSEDILSMQRVLRAT